MARTVARAANRAGVVAATVALVAQLVGVPAAVAADPKPNATPGFLHRDGSPPRAGTAVAVPAPGFQDTTVLTGLLNPTNIEFAPDGRIVIAEKRGTIKLYDSLTDTTPTYVVNWPGPLQTEVYDFWDRGLLGMTLSPNFGGSGTSYVYVSYTYDHILGDPAPAPKWSDVCPDPPGSLSGGCVASARLSRFPIGADGKAGAEQVLVEDWCQQFPSHSIGDLAFGPDGYLYASAGEAAYFGGIDYGQLGGNPCGDPVNQGGSLRAQSPRRAAGVARTLDGTVIRIDPATGLGAPTNPNGSSTDRNAARIVAHGFRNPFRIAFRPGAPSELWVGDVGDLGFEEVDRVPTPPTAVRNFGWPCYEGAPRHPGWDATNLPLCETLYSAGSSAVTAPFYTYAHDATVVSGESCPTSNGAVISGLAFYGGGPYPAAYDGALFFADHSRNCIWAMLPAATGGLPSAANLRTLVAAAANPVDLEIGPNGDLFYVDFDGGTIHRIISLGTNTPPTAVATATPTSGTAPLAVRFDGSASSDAEGAITYDWNFGDGSAHSTAAAPTHTYAAGTFTATLTVTDDNGIHATDTVEIAASNSRPVPSIATPSASLRWVVGQAISFSGSASDAEDGVIPASRLSWRLIIDHCILGAGCHQHIVQTWSGVSGGSFNAPDHAYPSHLELELTATDSKGATATIVRELDPKTVDLTFTSSPTGATLTVGASSSVAPFTRTVIVGSRNTVVAPTSATIGGVASEFVSWSDGGARIHDIVAPATAATFQARFAPDAGDTCATATATTSGAWISERIAPGDADWYSVRLPATTYARVVLGQLNADLRLDLYSSCSTLVATSSRPGTLFESLYKRLAAGTYRMRVTGLAGATAAAPYLLRFRTLSERVQVLTSSTWTSGGTGVAVGMVLNNTAYYQRSIVVKATLMNAANQPIGTASTTVYASVLNPRTKAPFRLTFALPTGYHHATLSVSSTRTTLHALGGLTATAGTPTLDTSGRLHVRGTLRNANTFTVRSATVAVALLNNLGVVRNVLRVAPAATTLGAGASTTFDAPFADHFSELQVVELRPNGAR